MNRRVLTAKQRREKPVLWFSENPVWEPTANKVISTDGGETFRRPALRELHEIAGGIFRFRVIPAALAKRSGAQIKLFQWGKIQSVAHIAPSEAAAMVTAGLGWGATPTHWWGSLEPLPLSLIAEGLMQLERRSVPAIGEGPDVWSLVGLDEAVEGYLARGLRVHQTTASENPKVWGV
ncbi:hypothetical protein [Paucibacter soli]|uniref:hypothetical protein n=1 Tax=Paucibacter soli TaxID=3133433 RepID=UPI00309B4D82